jgi:hypothetical protein
MKRLLIGLAVWIGLVFFLAAVLPASVDDCFQATCRIQSGKAFGTGVVYGQAGGEVLVLTNAHVVEGGPPKCWFWYQGHESAPLQGRVLGANSEVDAAAVGVPIESFEGRLPTQIPIAEQFTLQPGDAILSVGCAGAAWQTAFKGHYLGEGEQGSMVFLPTPADGRSGSGIFDAKGTQIIGLLYARDSGERWGYAVPLAKLRASIRFTQCGPNGCPPSGGEKWRGIQIGGGEGFRVGGGSTYPTLPTPGFAPLVPVAPQCPPEMTDGIRRIEEKIDAIGVKVGAVARPEDIKAAVEEVKPALGAEVAKAVSGAGLTATIRSAVTKTLGWFGLGGGLFSFVLIGGGAWFLARLLRNNALAIAVAVDKLTDRIPGTVDDKLLDEAAYRLAEIVSGKKRPVKAAK